MIVRIWTTKFDPARLDELDAFANEISLPVLRRQPGNQGVLFGSDGDEWVTVTLWADAASIARLDEATDYQETVARILAAGFLRGEQVTRLYDDHGADIAPSTTNPGPA